METDLSLEELREQGLGRDIFPPSAFFALRDALLMEYIFCLSDLFAISIRLPRRPQNREYSRSLLCQSTAKLDSRTAVGRNQALLWVETKHCCGS
jgi:hypothetical protein